MHTHSTSMTVALAALLALGPLGVLPTTQAHAQEPPEQPNATPAEVIPVIAVFMALARERDEAALEAEFKRQFPAFAEQHGLREVGREGKPELTLRLQVMQMENDPTTYVIYTTAIYHDKVDSFDARSCLQCSPADVVANLLSNVASAAAAVLESRAELATAASVDVPVAEVPHLVTPPSPPRVRTIGATSYVGFASAAVGVGATIWGAVLINRGVVVESEPLGVTQKWTDYRPTGIALMGVGLGMVVIGNVLVGVDLGVLLPRRHARAQAQIDGVSVTTAGGPGLAIRGRF